MAWHSHFAFCILYSFGKHSETTHNTYQATVVGVDARDGVARPGASWRSKGDTNTGHKNSFFLTQRGDERAVVPQQLVLRLDELERHLLEAIFGQRGVSGAQTVLPSHQNAKMQNERSS